MDTQPDHDRLDRKPFWRVQAVFDPDGGGAEFAYTIGLHERGLPELHIWGRPDSGDDPGLDWMFSCNDRCRILNVFAWQLVDGKLAVGQERTEEYDAGEAIAHFRVGPPGDRLALEALGTDPAAVVWPINWSLSRPPEGVAEPLSREASASALDELIEIVVSLDATSRVVLPSQWAFPTRPSFAMGQPFGPRTQIVLARAAQLAQASVDQLNCLLHFAADVDRHIGLSFPVTVARAVARRSGRRIDLRTLMDSVDSLVSWLVEAPANRGRWSEVVTSLYGPDGASTADEHRHIVSLLRDVALGCLAVEVVADVMADEWVLAGRGPWLTALGRPAGELPGPAFAAPPQVLAVVTDLLGPLTSQQIAQLVTLHVFARDADVDGWQDYSDVYSLLRSWSVVGAAGCPWDPTLSSLPAWTGVAADVGFRREDVTVAPLCDLQEWASCLTAALTHRSGLTADQVEAFSGPFVDVLPGLATVLNAPIALAS